ncbi:MAG: BMP family ABC transporter substrate-binding protein [Clostridia bacterium]|nr:BMP family ABC transporter substrate-binding protein [Clostridia bacterium]
MKKVLAAILCLTLAFACLLCTACNKTPSGESEPEAPKAYGFTGEKDLAKSGAVATTAADISITGDASALKIGLILVGDDTEGYTKAHMDGIKAAAQALGIQDSQLIWKYKVEENEAVTEAGKQLITEGCTYIFSNSYGHQDYMAALAKDYPNVHFVAMTGDSAARTNLPNFSNAFTRVYESRYVSGVVAGLKLAELIKDGKVSDKNKDGENIRIGYVGAYNYAEVVSGYTAFYLGLKSVVNNVVMDVYYTSSWFDFDKEKAAAETLISKGCIIIGQHADSAGAPTAVQEASKKGTVVYSVGYNVSMLDACPDAALTSASNTWQVYYQYAFAEAINNENIATNWAAGYDKSAVNITELGTAVAEGTAEKVSEVVAKLKAGEIKVFDTSKFTVGGKQVTWAYATDTDLDWTNDADNVISNGQYYESYVQSAPSFSLRIDGITELN